MRISKWGNSAAVRLSAFVTQNSGIGLDDLVQVKSEPGRIVLEKIEKPAKRYNLSELLANTPSSILTMDDEWNNEAPQHGELI